MPMTDAAYINKVENDLLSACDDNTAKKFVSSGPADDLLVQCMNMAGAQQGLHFESSPFPAGMKVTDRIREIAQMSNALARKVSLARDWWKKDYGSFLGFTKDGNACALVLEKKAYYVFLPEANEKVLVTDEIIQNIQKTAFLFYPTLKSESISLSEFLNFGLIGRKSEIIQFLILSVFIALLNLALPIGLSALIGNVIPSANKTLLLQLSFAMVIIGVTLFVLSLFRNIILLRFEGKVDLRLQPAVWHRLLMLPASFFRKYSTGDLVHRAMGINSIRTSVSGPVVSALFTSLFLVFNLILLFSYSGYLAVFAIIIALIYFIILTVLYVQDYRINNALQHIKGILTGRQFQFINGISKIKTAGKELNILKQWTSIFLKERKMLQQDIKLNQKIQLLNYIFPTLAIIVIYAFSAKILNTISPRDFAGFVVAFGLLMANTVSLGISVSRFLQAIPVYKRLKPILAEASEPEPSHQEQTELEGAIEFNQVSFKYDPQSPLILDQVSFTIKEGEYVAFVGSSGSGKSTIFRLLMGFDQPLSGSIYYDNQDFKKLNKKVIRRQMGVVLQNSNPVGGTVFQNVAGSGVVSFQDVWRVLAMTGMEQEIKALPMGLHTMIPDSGGGFSGGQKQRLLIARALINKPKIILFDEATSALDNISQKIIIETLRNIKSTKVVVAHRLETIMGADKVFFLDQGHIIQSGKPQELLAQEGPFQEFAKRQLK